jgi:hypothetical protein
MNEYVSKIYNTQNDIWGLPQEYKGIKIYPLKIKDIKFQDYFYKTLAYPKNYIPDKKIIKMSYLKYLIMVVRQVIKNDIDVGDALLDLLKHTMQKEDISYEVGYKKDGEDFDAIDLQIIVGDIVLSENEFNDIREIILEQNGLSIEYIEEFNPELEERMSIFNKSTDINMVDEIFTFATLMNKTIFEIENYTLYQFKMHMEKLIIMKDFDMFKPLEISGQIKLKSGEIKHYLFHSKKASRYGSILVDREEFVKNNELFQSESIK